MTRSYGQFCGLARALDVVSGRWSLLIVRELLVAPARYGELQAGLPGISTNLLAERLRELEADGVVERRLDADRNGVVYALTPWGRELREPIAGLVRWSTPLMVTGPGEDSFRTHWLVVALESLTEGRHADVPAAVGVKVDGEILTVRIDATGVRAAFDGGDPPETVLRADPMVVLGLASGMLTVEQAVAIGELRGDVRDLAAIFGAGGP